MAVQSLTLRLQAALTRPFIPQRCQELIEILNDLSAKDASFVLKTIIESIFEVSRDDAVAAPSHYTGGWGLRFITATEHFNEFNALRSFLAANGPLLSLAIRITNDPFQSFPFPVSYLPSKVRLEIEEGSATPFYCHKIQNMGPGHLPIHIMLNAFEFYVFHFAHFLLGNTAASSGGSSYWSSMVECLYPTLVEDLLIAFMPLDASLPPGPSGVPIPPRGVLSQRVLGSTTVSGPNLNLSSVMSPILRPSRPVDGVRTLMDTSVSGQMGGTYTSSPLPSNTTQYIHTQPEFSTWTSQVVLQILLEKWVNQCITVPARANPSAAQSHAAYNYTQEIFVPSCDHVYIVRILVKHLHYFCNSIKPLQQLPLDQLRRSVWGMSRKIIYMFMKHLFLHWPLDSSFKLILETWLSFIQPWRYTTYAPRNKMHCQPMDVEANRTLDRKWIAFISENLLMYTYLFELLLGRLLRLDLASPKNAHILFRVSKVYQQDKLMEFIEEIEYSFGQNNVQKSFLGDFLGSPARAAVPESPPCRAQQADHMVGAHSVAQAARNHILEVEGQRHRYESLFSASIVEKVQCLLKCAKRAEEAISQEISASTVKNFTKNSNGILAYIINTLMASPQSIEEKQRLEDMQKSLTYLSLSSTHLCTIFKTFVPVSAASFEASATQQTTLCNISGEKISVPDQILTEDGPVLSQLGQLQVLNGLKRYDIVYEGDPDLKPICSFEVAFLVRFLYTLSVQINRKYEDSLTRQYYRKDFVGKLGRVFLRAPEIVYRHDKSLEGKRKKKSTFLPPRVSLRPLANKPLIWSILGFWIIFYLLGVNIFRVLVHLMVPLVVVYVVGKALMEPSQSRLELNVDIPHPGEPTLQ